MGDLLGVPSCLMDSLGLTDGDGAFHDMEYDGDLGHCKSPWPVVKPLSVPI